MKFKQASIHRPKLPAEGLSHMRCKSPCSNGLVSCGLWRHDAGPSVGVKMQGSACHKSADEPEKVSTPGNALKDDLQQQPMFA